MIEETIEQLRHLIADELDTHLQLDHIDADAPLLQEGLNLDSLTIVELITSSETRFGIEFRENDLTMDSFASLRALAAVIEARLLCPDKSRLETGLQDTILHHGRA